MSQGTHQERPAYMLEEVSRRREKGGVVFELSVPRLQVQPGEFIAIVGPSGCGKSTLLDLLGLVLQPDHAGQFVISIKDTRGTQTWDIPSQKEAGLAALRKQHIGYVLQNGGLLPFLSVRENIELTARLNRQPDFRKITLKLAHYLGIQDQLEKRPQQLSGGQRQRAAIARGLAHRPAILLADEPTAAVDRPTALEIRDQFSDLTRQYGVSVLMVTHDEPLVRPVVDRLLTFELEKASSSHTISRVIVEPVKNVSEA